MITHLAKEITPEDETIFLKARKHWFGLFAICSLIALTFITALGLFIWLSHSGQSQILSGAQSGALGLFLLFAFILVGALVAIISWLYRSSWLTVTDEEVRQVIQSGLFHRRSSRLALANVEDVTFVRKGIFASIFGFGELNIETAGEQANFKFSYCPKPEVCVKVVMDARERYFEQQSQSVQTRSITR